MYLATVRRKHNVMLCYVMLCYVMLCYVMLCYVMVWYVMLTMLFFLQVNKLIERVKLFFKL